LHLGNIALIDGEPTPFDCIEFNPEFRWIDVMSEIAFLVMDLLDRDLAAMAWRCLNRYLEISGDYDGIEVLRYYLVYRAMVRAKVALIHAHQNVTGSTRRDEEKTFSHHLRLAERLALPAHPALVLMHGLSGSGKTTASQALVEALGAVRVRSDIERKRICGLGADARSSSAVGSGIYDDNVSQRTYKCLAGVANLALRSGWRVIVDAASLRRQQRDAFRQIAHATAVPFVIVSCRAADDVLRERMAQRGAAGRDASEATAEVLEHQLVAQDALSAGESGDTIVIDETVADAREIGVRVAARLDTASSLA
jgi:predicted kinase